MVRLEGRLEERGGGTAHCTGNTRGEHGQHLPGWGWGAGQDPGTGARYIPETQVPQSREGVRAVNCARQAEGPFELPGTLRPSQTLSKFINKEQ